MVFYYTGTLGMLLNMECFMSVHSSWKEKTNEKVTKMTQPLVTLVGKVYYNIVYLAFVCMYIYMCVNIYILNGRRIFIIFTVLLSSVLMFHFVSLLSSGSSTKCTGEQCQLI